MFFRKLLYFIVVVSFFLPLSSWSFGSQSVWDVLRQQFSLNHEVTQPEVQAQLHWLLNHPGYIQKLTQSEPYMYHIMTELKKRHLPGEIALIPMIESAYDPFAYSGAGAAGLWQLMPGTGTDLGLKQDWWYDGRRSISSSTDAALNYLDYLHRFFNGNWILAFAAYDSGEGTMARIIKASNQSVQNVNFWSLPVPRETRAYVPRLLALAEIIQNAPRYHVQLPDIPHVPYFEEVNIGTQIDLNHAAKLAGISYRDLIKLNPGYNRWATAPYRPYKLLIPANKVERFSRNLANVPEDQRVSWTRHQVSAGDNLGIIAERYHTTVNLIKELNQLKSNAVTKGQYVLIPSKTATITSRPNQTPAVGHYAKPSAYKIIYIVDKKDTIQDLEQKFHVSIAKIKQWNNLSPSAPLRVGQSLVIWKSTQHLTYVVKPGDSLSRIAQNNHTTTKHLVELNPKLDPARLRLGQVLLLS
ncbi:MAG: lytic transglycosylase [Legionella sp.]|nr:MAG: lytic transglycosylase [Legionella sp.]